MVGGSPTLQPEGMTVWRNEEDTMAVPPRPTDSDRGMLLLVVLVLVALIVALIVLFAG